MARYLLCASLFLIWMGLPTGCVNVDAKAPENISWGSPPPPASIPRADPNSKSDLLRENQQLRERVTWLEEQNRKSAKKLKELEDEQRDIQAEMDKIAAERDRYRRAADH
ncbi:MAG: hypothetical protein ABSH10_06255 [Phycisphaerae bacterium]